MNKIKSNILQYLTAVLLVLGISGNAAADNGCLSLQTTDTGKIGSQASCADFNMSGCVVGSRESGCSYTGNDCNFEVAVSPRVGDADSTTFSAVGSGCQIRKVIAQGNQRGNFCLFTYFEGVLDDTVTTTNDRGDAISHKQVEFCTDEKVVALGKPVARISKTIARVFEDESGDDVFDCNESADSFDVVAPTKVAYCYEASNDGEGPLDEAMVLDDNGTPDDPNDDIVIDDIGSVPGGGSVMRDSGVVMITDTGEVVSTVTVSGLHLGADCETCSDSNTATLTVVVACDSDTQVIANATGDLAGLSGIDGSTLCGPEEGSAQGESFALLCDPSCKLRPECKDDPNSCKSPCLPSNSWVHEDEFGQCIAASPGPGKKHPLCKEVLSNITNNDNCDAIKNPSWLRRQNGNQDVWQVNPTIICVGCDQSGGGDSTGTVYCILDPGESRSVCPKGSFIF